MNGFFIKEINYKPLFDLLNLIFSLDNCKNAKRLSNPMIDQWNFIHFQLFAQFHEFTPFRIFHTFRTFALFRTFHTVCTVSHFSHFDSFPEHVDFALKTKVIGVGFDGFHGNARNH